jgi:hypothetical protein
MNQPNSDWSALAHDLQKFTLDFFNNSNVPVTDKGYSDEKFLALTLLARTYSNAKSALILLEATRVIEARVLVRCCLENSYWVAGLAVGGEKFAREMLHDEMNHKRRRGQRLFDPDIKLPDETKTKLAAWLKQSAKQFKDAKSLNPMGVAMGGALARSYIFYELLSSDAAHPSIEALNRHVIPHTADETGGVDVDPVPRDAELIETFEYLCMATIGVVVGVNQIIGGTRGANQMNALADRFTQLSNQAAADGMTVQAHARVA